MPYELLEENTTPQEESTLGLLGRTGARSVARGIESVLGLPGDIGGSLLNLTNYGINKISGSESPLPSRLPIPTSEDIKQSVTKPLTGEYLEPQGQGEQFLDDIIGDAATLFLPLKGKVPFKKALAGSLGKSAVGNLSKWAAEEVTGSPFVGAAAKIGSMALAGTAGGRKELNKIKTESYKDAFSKIPEKTKFNFSQEKKKIDSISKILSRGDRKDKDFLMDRLKSIENISKKSGKFDIKEAIGLKQDWNKYLSDPSLKKSSRDTLKQAVGIINDGISRYGSENPAFYTPYKIGEELTASLQNTNYVQKLLSKHPYLSDNISNPLVKYIFWGTTSNALTKHPKAVAGTIAAGLAAKETAKAYELLSRSPIARKYYKDIIQSSLKNNTQAIARDLARFDKLSNSFYEKNKDFDSDTDIQEARYEVLD